jgi:hypothetical protein
MRMVYSMAADFVECLALICPSSGAPVAPE